MNNGKGNVVSDVAKGFIKKKIILLLLGGVGSIFSAILIALPIFIALLVVLGIISGGGSGESGGIASNNGECGFTISATSLSKSDFKSKIESYANGHSQWKIFADYSDDYYDYAKAKGVNPELVVLVAAKENGGKDLSTNNYWGLKCPNGSSSCGTYSSFMDGAKALIDSASKYSSLSEWMGKYSYIGYFWYNPGSAGDGGCYYAPYIFGNNIPDRVQKACSGSKCSYSSSDQQLHSEWQSTGVNSRTECTPTTDEDQKSYTTYLINSQMANPRKDIFGLDASEGVSCTSGASSNFVESYVQWMIKTAADDSVGYDRNSRDLNPNVDCSSFVWFGLVKGAGVDANSIGGSAFATGTMTENLTSIGFKKYTYTSKNDLKRGDILWVHIEGGHQHTEVYVGDGQNVGAHSNYDGKNGDSSGNEVNVKDTNNDTRGWAAYFRYEGKNS